ncbi:MAG: hypothetical protein HY824_03375 [Acidobacteria bacterium]|nr:hypothetical protein [Acidobacteriota bacterium]
MNRSTLATTIGILAVAATAFAAPATSRPTWASGQLERYDAVSKTVVVKQGTHEMTFVLASDAHLMRGKSALQTGALATDVGRNVKVRYTTTAGTMTADRIEVAAAAAARPAASPAKK